MINFRGLVTGLSIVLGGSSISHANCSAKNTDNPGYTCSCSSINCSVGTQCSCSDSSGGFDPICECRGRQSQNKYKDNHKYLEKIFTKRL